MSSTWRAILAGGFIAGTIDIGAAVALYHIGPITILQAIASGVLGKASYSGGLNTALLGLVLQWAMSLIIAAIFVFAANRLPVLKRRWLVMGLAYGVGIFVVMTFIVVPLSASYPKNPPKLPGAAEQFAAMLLFGVIVSYCAERFGSNGLGVATRAVS
ncbi:MAG TPA: hypothetical protein VHX92_09470 [Rhizomicrobium sp.]|jgi:uncharacterized membrane protein YagU involved in acid resistance|nr:hypothetical protein [Rhizomicrobium sp.]